MMALFPWRKAAGAGPEKRDLMVTQSSPDFLAAFGLSPVDVVVTTETALGVPAIWAAVNFIAGTIAGLPLHVYRATPAGGQEKVADSALPRLLGAAPNAETSSFSWRKTLFQAVLTGGRHVTFIERNVRGEVVNLWPLMPAGITVKKTGGKTVYEYRESGQPLKKYRPDEVLDLAFMRKDDGIGHRGPIATNAEVIGLAINATKFGSRFFANGGVPPFAVTGNFQSGKAMDRASDDLHQAILKGAKDQRQALVLPTGLDIKSIGADAEKSQLVELKKFCVEEIARIYSLPPTFLQDLSHGSYSNTEQQDLHFVKHTLKRWVEEFEQELNLKLFGADGQQWVKLNMDGLLRGDFKTRMEGYASAIQNAVMTPNEARRLENRPDMDEGDRLLIQGATVPLGSQPDAAQADPGATRATEVHDAVLRYLTT